MDLIYFEAIFILIERFLEIIRPYAPIIIFILTPIILWRIFEKADHIGWTSFIPIYNVIALFRIARISWILIILLLIPVINYYVATFMLIWFPFKMARAFDKGLLFAFLILIAPLIGFAILAFSDATYEY